MKFALLFSILFFASHAFSQAPLDQPFSKTDILIMTNQYAAQKQQTASRGNLKKLDSSQTMSYSEWSQSWYEGYKTRYTYFSDGSIKAQVSETFESFTDKIAFNESGNIQYHKYQNWNGSFFEDSFNTVYIYDNNDILVNDSNYEWTGSRWNMTGYSEYQTNSQGQMQQKIAYQVQGSMASPTQKFAYVNNTNGQILNLTTFQYLNGQWENHYNYFYSYNTLDRNEDFYYQNWLSTSWVNVYRAEFTYVSNNQTLSESFYWDNGSWLMDSKQEYQYNTGTPTNSVWLPAALGLNNHMITGNQTYFYTNGLWGYVDSTTYYSSEATPTSVALIAKENPYKLQTNPVISEINIVNKSRTSSKINVYSYTGNLLISKTSSQAVIRLDANELSNGMYLVHIQNANDKHVLKILIAK